MYVTDISGVATRLFNYDTVVYVYVYVYTLTHIGIFITITTALQTQIPLQFTTHQLDL